MKQINLTEREKSLLLVSCYLIITMAVILYLLVPAVLHLESAVNELTAVNRQLKAAKFANDNLTLLKQENQTLMHNLQDTERLISQPQQLTTLLFSINETAELSGVKLKALFPAGPSQQKPYGQEIILVKAEGSLAGIMRFMQELEGLNRLCSFHDFQLMQQTGTAGNYLVQFRIAAPVMQS